MSNNNQWDNIYKDYGIMFGMLAGLVVGGTVAFTLLSVFFSPAIIAMGALIVFTLVFTSFGAFMGILFDVDAHERGAGSPQTVTRRKRPAKTQPLPLLSK